MKQLCKCMRDHVGRTCMVLSVILVLTMILATGIGPVSIPFGTVWRVVWNYLTGAGDVSDIKMSTQNIVWHLRVPRVLMGAMVGASLSLSGVAMQSFTKNPLASPYVLGISSGATFGATLAIVTGVLSFLGSYAVEGGAFAGAMAAILIVYYMAKSGKGLQIGLFNYYKENFDGFQLGLVNANPDTKVQLMLFGGNTTKLNVGARFKNKLFYTILGGGTHYLDFSDKFSASLFYRAGLELPLYKQLFISGDLGFQHIENFKNKDYGFPARLYALQARVNLEYRLTDRLGIFVTGGYGGSRYYNKGVTYDKGVILEGGVVLFKY